MQFATKKDFIKNGVFLLKLNFHHFHFICNFSISRAPPSSDKLINCLASPLLLRWENTQASILITTFRTSCHLGYSQKKSLLTMIFWIYYHLRHSQKKGFLIRVFMTSWHLGDAFSKGHDFLWPHIFLAMYSQKQASWPYFFMASCHLGYPQESTTSIWALAVSLCQPSPSCQRMIPYKLSYLKGINAEI